MALNTHQWDHKYFFSALFLSMCALVGHFKAAFRMQLIQQRMTSRMRMMTKMRPTMKMMDVTRQVWFNWSSSAAKTVCNSSIQCTSAVALHHPVLRHPLYQSTMLYHVLSFQCTESWGQDNILVFWHKGTISMCSWAIFLLIEALYVALKGRTLAPFSPECWPTNDDPTRRQIRLNKQSNAAGPDGRWLSQLNHLLVSWSPNDANSCKPQYLAVQSLHTVSCAQCNDAHIVPQCTHCKCWWGSQILRWHWIAMLVAWGYRGSPVLVFNQTLHNVKLSFL